MRTSHYIRYTTLAIMLLYAMRTQSQTTLPEKTILHQHIDTLTAPGMHGRGYVLSGKEIASAYIQAKFRALKLLPVLSNELMTQYYSFNVNTFPGRMEVTIDDRTLKPGEDYIIDAASSSFLGDGLAVVVADMPADAAGFREKAKTFDRDHIYLLRNTDSFCKKNEIKQSQLIKLLPRGCYIIPQTARLIWTVSKEQADATIFYVKETSLPAKPGKARISVQCLYNIDVKNDNIIAQVPGEIKDTFIAFSAHYDHLGRMGEATYFPGASDNASGTAMLLYLASYFAAHPQHYSIMFIAFSGEEAGLMGSAYYTAHPAVPLKQIKFLANIDIMGDATDGITVVNATEYPKQFALLNKVNDANKYLPAIKSRGKAANSDHYHFSEKGVPAIFIYSNGGKGYYHDIYDKGSEVTLNNVDGVAKLLIDFTATLR